MADITPEAERAASFGKMAMASNLGFVLGPAIAGVLGATRWGERAPVLAAIVISMVATALILWRLPDTRQCKAPGSSGNPVGRVVRLGGPDADPVLVVGVVEDGKYNTLEEGQEPYLYLPISQRPWGEVLLLAETEGNPTLLASPVRAVISSLSPDTYVLPQSTLSGLIRDATYNRRILALVLGVFALLGLVLAGVGLYGVSAHAVNRQSKEIGIRMALGADGRRILRLVLRQGGRLILLGTCLGIPGAVAIGLALRSSLFGVRPVDYPSLVGAAAILGLVTMAAVLLPSRRATTVDPLTVIRHE